MFPDEAVIGRAVALLQAGELVAFPTETVYGLGADAANPAAVGRIFTAKGRPADHPLIVHLPARRRPRPLGARNSHHRLGAGRGLLAGPADPDSQARSGSADRSSPAVRIPSACAYRRIPLALALLRAYAEAGGGVDGLCGIAAPSANRFGRISPTEAAHVRAELGDAVQLILDGGRCQVGIESTIVDLTRGDGRPPRLLRPGRVTPEQIARSSACCRKSSRGDRTTGRRASPGRSLRTMRRRLRCAS
jgi:L-threonylcarbamoyladenylate synthase